MSAFLRLILLGSLLAVGLLLSPATQAQGTRLSCRIEPSPVAVNGQAVLTVELAGVQNLYGYELKMNYNPGLVQIQDGDAERGGTNLQLVSEFISPDFVVLNSAENGVISLVLTQLAPNPPRSGNGILARATLVGVAAGFANFAFTDVILSDNNGQVIPVQRQDCWVEIGTSGQPTPTHTAVPTQVPTNTPAPTATWTAMAQVPTATFTPVPPTATFTPLPPTPTSVPAQGFTFSDEQDAITPETPTATATIFVVTTPTLPAPTADLSALRVDDVQSPQSEAATAPVGQSVGESSAWAGADNTASQLQSPMPAAGQEVLSPVSLEAAPVVQTEPIGATDLPSAVGEVLIPTATVEPTPTPTPTALMIARVVQPAPLPVEMVQQPEAIAPPLTRDLLLPRLGWIFLLVTSVLMVAAWRLRRS
ncbi:MAG: hypothetical protein KF893_20535 [Caldilineaceae bacterium]|nr:hypothetical protein [Caldilineaceae bacterium]